MLLSGMPYKGVTHNFVGASTTLLNKEQMLV